MRAEAAGTGGGAGGEGDGMTGENVLKSIGAPTAIDGTIGPSFRSARATGIPSFRLFLRANCIFPGDARAGNERRDARTLSPV